ncbi:MAG: hypothetical protein K2M09_09305 [Muribaculaceae bacterium]|nr:hypothetical protein [Bacteroides sp.]MBD5363314.1 hypothetical protein [Bacteroides sp.]MDE6033624.1 hypothetical protein [Muribaculaceae bacterium]MDE6263482.1 hypothetical protein [Muribaculaceae bacterium]
MKRVITYIIICVAWAIGARAESVMMIGDSHVAGKTYPHTVDSLLSCRVDSCRFNYFGINGASFATFCKPENLDSIYAYRPDILLVHLGTNDSYCRRFNQETFLQNLTTFYQSVHDSLPEVKMVFVTPFVNKLKRTIRTKKKRRRTVWDVNQNTRTCSELIGRFCDEHPADTRLVDHNATHGMEFLSNGLIFRDFVHLTVPGYILLGTQVVEELINLPNLFSVTAEQ